MGRCTIFHSENATRKNLSDYLRDLGFEKCEHFWDWPKGTLNYYWFNHEDFKSIDGVSADIYPITENEQVIAGSQWSLHLRNNYSASWHDVEMLNRVLKGAKKRFGGTITGDYGTNRYAPLWEDKSTPISRGMTGTYQHVKQQMNIVKISLPEPSINNAQRTGQKIDDLIEFSNSLYPNRLIYNGLVPFAVSMFEYFFSQAFQILIAYDESALKKRIEVNS